MKAQPRSEVVSVRIEAGLLTRLDDIVSTNKSFKDRSQFVGAAIREKLIKDFQDSELQAIALRKIGKDILAVQFAWPVGKPLVDNLGDGVCEVRSRLSNRIARTLFAVVDEEIVLLHGFIKKQQRTPSDELDLAKKRKKQYLL